MKFSCEKVLLQNAVSVASRTVSPKSSIPALEGILLEAESSLLLTGYNMQTGIRTTVEANIEKAGRIVLNSRLFGEIVRKLPDDIVFFSSNDKCMVTIRCGISEFNILGTDAEEYPELPSVEQQNGFSLTQQALRSMIGETLFAVSDNESRPIHTGSLFELDDTGLTVVSVDGFRLALRQEPIEHSEGSGFSFVVPGNALSEVEKIASDEEKMATITVGGRHVLFQMGDTLLISRRLEGDFLDYKKAVPRTNKIKITANTQQLADSIERVSLIISDKQKSPVRCVLEKNVLKVSSSTALGTAYDECPVEGDGGGLEIGFNNKYLLDALKKAPADSVHMEFNTSVSPCILLPAEGEKKFLYMVLPVRLKANEGQ
ncbi:DNA polymerase III subunit beta [Papillibacter cinnamivorans]|uniref:Beta sliding clamp n=1 Tax=Papillibacter cinnamivorans DSM 12816 TaxID=1122930 RepID=A0A1W2AAC2_9FIRM|nr:DNA polymerase III subunit beta [Papillibacter cinnamivorans]SMC57371.1 DNA polymerase-3 subunit beta [Papillibacter cinnamivorans DSM 12816]